VKNFRVSVNPICLLAAGFLLSACSSTPPATRPENPYKTAVLDPNARTQLSDRDLKLQADQLYRRAHGAIVDTDYSQAIKYFDQLSERYPFSEYQTQAEMEKIYAQYRSYQPDDALSGADRFLRAHPRSSQAEYVQYLKGVINYTRDEGLLDVFGLDNAAKDVGNARRSFGDFALLIQRYPNSKYCGDARRRMIYLRDRIARHELSIARYYMRRGAYIAAVKRADDIIAEYPGAPATQDALQLVFEADRRLGLNDQAGEASKIIAFNADDHAVAEPRAVATTMPATEPAPPPAPTRVALLSSPTAADSTPQPPAPPAEKAAAPPGFFSKLGKALKNLIPFMNSDAPSKTSVPTNPTNTDPVPVIPAPGKPVQP